MKNKQRRCHLEREISKCWATALRRQISASRGTGRRWEGMNKAEARGSFLLPDFISWMPAKRGLGKMLLLGLSVSVAQEKKKK